MKKILIVILAVIVSYPLQAQRAEMEKVDIKIKRLPSRPLPLEVKKYNYKVMNLTLLSLSPETLNAYLRLDGFEFSSTSPDVTLLVYLDKYDEKLSTVPVKGISETKYAYVIKSSLDVRLGFVTGDTQYEGYSI
jgi:hypothetical protein